MLVYGTSLEDQILAQSVAGWYAAAFDSFTLRRVDALTDQERSENNLMVLGTPATNPLLLDLELAVRFSDGSFEFGKNVYDQPGNGIALISPNPWNADRWVTVYGGNTLDGAFSTFTIWTGAADYETTRGRGVIEQEGNLCHDNWLWYNPYDENYRKDWDAYRAGLESEATAFHVFWFEGGSDADVDRDWFPEWQEAEYAAAVELLEVQDLAYPIQTYLYTTRASKEQWTGDAGNAFANDLNYEVHALYGEGVYAVGAHEDVHVIAWHQIGEANSALLGEGLAVWVDGWWNGAPLEDWATEYLDSGEIPSLDVLIDNFWSESTLVTYPLAGHFVGWLVQEWGLDATKRIYTAADLRGALVDETGMDLVTLEAAWLNSIPSSR